MTEPLLLETVFEGGRPSRAALEAVQAHPRFAEAMRAVVAGWMGMSRGSRLMNTLVTDRGRMLLSLFAVYLHEQRHPGDPTSGLTSARMKAALAPHNVCSPGRIDALLALMRLLGYLTVQPDGDDRRVRRLQPTAKLLETQRRRALFTFEAMAIVLAVGGEALAMLSQPGFLTAYVSRTSELHLAGNFYVKAVPEMAPVHENNGGLAAMYCLLMAGRRGDSFPPSQPVQVSVSGIARQLGISRAQASRLFAVAEAQDLIAREGSGESWHLLPKMHDASRRLVAHFLVQNAHAARLALSEFAHQNMAA